MRLDFLSNCVRATSRKLQATCLIKLQETSLKLEARSLKPILLFILWVITLPAMAQEFSIKKIELTGESVILHYDLIDTIKARTYTINVYASKDSYLAPLQKIKGDAGLEVRPGQNKKIVWSSKEELGPTFRGDIELEVRGRVYIPFVKFEGFQDEQVIKRGKAKTMTWSGGTRQNILNFTLYKGDEYIDVIPNVANSGSYDMIIPTSVKPGKGYYFLVSDSKNKDQVMKTNTFTVKRKVPLGLKLLPIVIIGAAIPFLGGDPGPDELDTPFDPPPAKN
jgi:hypothetical protein